MSDTPKKGGYIKQAWLVILLALLYGAALAGVQTTLGPIIAQNKEDETRDQIPQLLLADVPETDWPKLSAPELFVGTDKDGRPFDVLKITSEPDGKHEGWILRADGAGFADRIEMLIGLSPEADMVKGIYVLDQKETPGLGDKIREQWWREQFKGKSTAQRIKVAGANVPKDQLRPSEINSLTGATISSDAVSGIVNTAVKNLKTALAESKLEKKAAPKEDVPTPEA